MLMNRAETESFEKILAAMNDFEKVESLNEREKKTLYVLYAIDNGYFEYGEYVENHTDNSGRLIVHYVDTGRPTHYYKKLDTFVKIFNNLEPKYKEWLKDDLGKYYVL